MGALFSTPQAPMIQPAPPAPSSNDDAAQAAADRAQREARMARGRASTFLTNPQTQRTAQENQQRKALGGY